MVCQSDRSSLVPTISWLSFQHIFRDQSRMYSSGSIVALGIPALEDACNASSMYRRHYSARVRVTSCMCTGSYARAHELHD